MTIRVAIVGTGSMAANHASGYACQEGVDVVAGVDTDLSRAETFCKEHGIARAFSSIQELLKWNEFDAVSNATPDGVHHATSLPFITAGKHIMCEKPLAANYPDALEMAEKASAAGIVNCVNLSYREVPALQYAKKLVSEGAIGSIRHFEASYLQSWLTQPAWGDWKTEEQWLWRLSSRHGSNGVLGDVGVHILDFATFVAGSLPKTSRSLVKTFDKAPEGKIQDYVLDANDSFVMHTELENGAIGTISATRFASGHLNDLRLRVYGTLGGLEVLFENKVSTLNVCLGENLQTARWKKVETEAVPTNYQRFIEAIKNSSVAEPDFALGAKLQKLIDFSLQGDQAT